MTSWCCRRQRLKMRITRSPKVVGPGSEQDFVARMQQSLTNIFVASTLRLDMGNVNRSVDAAKISNNRLGAIIAHATRYDLYGVKCLAADSGVSKATISRWLNGSVTPLYIKFAEVVKCLEAEIGIRIPTYEILRGNDGYPTPFVCQLVGCRGCLPDAVMNSDGSRKSEFLHVKSGKWSGDMDEFSKAIKEEEQ